MDEEPLFRGLASQSFIPPAVCLLPWPRYVATQRHAPRQSRSISKARAPGSPRQQAESSHVPDRNTSSKPACRCPRVFFLTIIFLGFFAPGQVSGRKKWDTVDSDQASPGVDRPYAAAVLSIVTRMVIKVADSPRPEKSAADERVRWLYRV